MSSKRKTNYPTMRDRYAIELINIIHLDVVHVFCCKISNDTISKFGNLVYAVLNWAIGRTRNGPRVIV